jgi:hypothetical protein
MLQGHQVTVEITSGQTYRGKLIEGALEGEEAMRRADQKKKKANAPGS